MSKQLDRAKVAQWLDAKWKKGKQCPVCGQNDWAVIDLLWEVPEFHSTLKGGFVLPSVAVTCSYCGNILFFNALLMGLVDESEAQPRQRPTDEEAAE